jgi:hypothetical protein
MATMTATYSHTRVLQGEFADKRVWWDIYHVAVVQTGASADTLKAAGTKRIRLLAFKGTMTATGSIQWKSGSTVKSGVEDVADTGQGYVLAPNDDGWVQTAAAEALNFTTLSGGMNGMAIVAVEQ